MKLNKIEDDYPPPPAPPLEDDEPGQIGGEHGLPKAPQHRATKPLLQLGAVKGGQLPIRPLQQTIMFPLGVILQDGQIPPEEDELEEELKEDELDLPPELDEVVVIVPPVVLLDEVEELVVEPMKGLIGLIGLITPIAELPPVVLLDEGEEVEPEKPEKGPTPELEDELTVSGLLRNTFKYLEVSRL